MRRSLRGAVATALLLATAVCGGRAAREADRPFTGGFAAVQSLDVAPQVPQQPVVRIVARGTLPDACTKLDRQQRERRGYRIRITLTTRRESGAICAGEPQSFQRTLVIGVGDLTPGLYKLNVNDVETVFEVIPNPNLHEGIHRQEVD